MAAAAADKALYLFLAANLFASVSGVLGQQAGYQVGVVEGLNEMLLQPPLHAVDEKVHHSLGHGIREHAAGDGEVAAEEDPGHQHLEELLVSLGLARLNPPGGSFRDTTPFSCEYNALTSFSLSLTLSMDASTDEPPESFRPSAVLALFLASRFRCNAFL